MSLTTQASRRWDMPSYTKYAYPCPSNSNLTFASRYISAIVSALIMLPIAVLS